MSANLASATSNRGALPPHLLSNTPPTPSRSPSNASTGGDASGNDAEDESADESDFPEGDDADPDASSLSLTHLSPALATPKPSASSPWPFNAPGSAVGPAFPTATAEDDEEYIPASSLPHEILLQILRLLPMSSLAPALRVCKAWCQCGVELLWHKPMFKTLPSLYRMLQVLSLPPAEQTFPYPEFVRRLNFNNLHSEMSDRMLAKLLPCTRIERLTLTGCKGLTGAAMVSLLAQSKRLVALDLSDVDGVDDAVLEAMARNCQKIQGLNMSGCARITDRGLEMIATSCPSLRRIKLRKCDAITDVPIILLSLHCPLLLEVDLAGCSSVTALSAMQLLRTSRCLRELSLPGCVALTDDGFPDPEHLSLLPVSSAAEPWYPPRPAEDGSGSFIYELGDDYPESTETLSTTTGATLPCPVPLRTPPALRPYDHLRYLDVTSCALLTDQSIAGIVKYAPKLRNLILAKCARLTDDALFEICKVGKHLHYLHLGHVGSITDRSVIAIARSCTRLRYIDLANCNNVTDASVVELAANLPRLKRIGLVRVTAITDVSLYALHVRTSLERIHLSYCENLTVAAVNDMLQRLPRLTHLSLTGVPSFRKRVLQQFCRAPPREFNDHQRRSFCVFSGRGVQDLRKYLRSLSSIELAALAQPDPQLADDALAQAGAVGGHPGHPATAGVGGNAAQIAATQQRLQQIQQARQAVAAAAARLQAHQQARAGGAAAANGQQLLGAAQQQPHPHAQPPAPGGAGFHPQQHHRQQQLGSPAQLPPFSSATANPPQPIPQQQGVNGGFSTRAPAAWRSITSRWGRGRGDGNGARGAGANGDNGAAVVQPGGPATWNAPLPPGVGYNPYTTAAGFNPYASGANMLGLQQLGSSAAGPSPASTSAFNPSSPSTVAQGQPVPVRFVTPQQQQQQQNGHGHGQAGSRFSAPPALYTPPSVPTASTTHVTAAGSSYHLAHQQRQTSAGPSASPHTPQNGQAQAMEVDLHSGGAGAGGSALRRPRGATVTRNNYAAADEEDLSGSGSEGEEEDIGMGID
ncbi:hypothetical protein JCM10213_000251 [Rhodosporidiobolus nylandii]